MFLAFLALSLETQKYIDIPSILNGVWYINITSSFRPNENPKQYHLRIEPTDNKYHLVYNVSEIDKFDHVIISSPIVISNHSVQIYNHEQLVIDLNFDLKEKAYLAASGMFNESHMYSVHILNNNAIHVTIINQDSNEITIIRITRDRTYIDEVHPIKEKIYSYVFLGVTMALSYFIVKKMSFKMQNKKIMEELKKIEDEEKESKKQK